MNSEPATAPAVLFDIDGTLVDSNYLHVHAWCRAFADTGVDVDAWRIHRCIGMDGSTLLEVLAGHAPDDVRTRAAELHSRYYKETSPLLRTLPGTRDLLGLVAQRGLQVVLATSAPQDELEILRDLLDVEELVSVVTSGEDVEVAKPAPHIVDIALDRAGVSADRAVFIGDSVWDAEASTRAGVTCVGVRSGGVSGEELEAAGASAVFDDVRGIVDHFNASPLATLR